MGLFNLFKKKEKEETKEENNVLLAMPLFTDRNRYDLKLIINSLTTDWNLAVSNIEGDDDTAVLTIDGELVAIAFLDAPIPWEELETAASYAYNWHNAMDDLRKINAHAIVSVMSGTRLQFERYQILSKVLYSILKTSDCIGIYQGSQTLLIPKNQYLDYYQTIQNNQAPVPLWIYIGIRKTDSRNSLYTYGLKDFDKKEIEIIDSQLDMEEIYSFLMNICAYVIQGNISFKNGETLGYTQDQKINITCSKGIFVDEETLKLEM